MGALDRRVVVVSNRLPVVIERDEAGALEVRRGSGGLVSALLSVLEGERAREGGRWIGWLGSAELGEVRAALPRIERELGCRLLDVPLSEDEVADYYRGYSNEILWPLFHDQLVRCRFEPRYWQAYERVNRKFAQVVAERTSAEDLVWVHDYQLIRVAAALREAGVERRLVYFLHIPFPTPDLFARLPQREALLDGLLAYDVVGFQTERDLGNFLACATSLRDDLSVEVYGDTRRIRSGAGALTIAAVAPISVDFEGLVEAAARAEVGEAAARLRAPAPNRQLVLGLDRLDYSKGIPQRLAAFDRMLERHPALRGRVRLIQIVIPSRAEIGEYQRLEREIERMVGAINGRWWRPGWTPVEYVYRSLAEVELLGCYRAADVALVTPIKDGMNLVAKEYCACCIDHLGVLVLSEFAGAALELGRDCLLVNPHDVERLSAAIHAALTMTPAERVRRMRALREVIARADIFAWVERFFALVPESAPPQRTHGAVTGEQVAVGE